ncbi:MAG: choice-of-anchor Q domain-containing protein [Chloroflexota bacterium]|nr:hypothetical protein [Chloroflexota bacterium]MBI5702011.1 hypothetical protein [Chloroflexota bacterium]
MVPGRKLISALALLGVLFGQFAYPQGASAAAIRYVTASGGLETGPCDSWANACTLQRALFVAGGGDEVWVQQGTYKPTTGTDRSASFVIRDGVAVYGGFLGTETARSQRNPNPANTILSGEIGDQNLLTDNSFHVVTIDNAGLSTLLDGFTITRGYVADADGNPYGAGVYITNSSPTLNNLIITDNRAGSTVGSGGGGIYIDDTDGLPLITPTISNVKFLNNYSGRGGGLFSQRSSPILTNVVFEGNQALATGGGGANFQNLQATDPYINPVLTNVSFINNTATGGGGMFLGTSSGSLTNVTFSGNVANRRGGGLLLEFSSAVLTNVTFYNNTSNNNLADPKGGGGMMVIASSPTLNHVTFSGNTSSANGVDGGAIRVAKDPAGSTVSNPVIRNAIFWGNNSTGITSDGTGSITIHDSIVQGGCPAGAACTNVLNANPLLGTLTNNGGFTQSMALGMGSPAIDAGNNSTCASTDQRGVARPQWSGCDMGAFETGAHIDNAAVDFTAGTVGSCVVDNLIGDGAVRLNIPSSTTCTFESRVFDVGTPMDWVSLSWSGATPAGTTVAFAARTGNSPIPDNTWTNWQAVNGNFTNPGSRYLQYRAMLSTTNNQATPAIENIALTYVVGNISALNSPDGALSAWNGAFSWTGVNGATWYLLEVYTSTGTQLLRKWYTSAQTGCPSGTACSLTPSASDLSLGNGNYQWRVLDYGAYGYGIFTLFKNFTLSTACYTLTVNLNPSGSGSVNVPAQTCSGGYTAGSVVQLTATPGTGYAFSNWSGDVSGTTNPVAIVMDGSKTVTANMRGNTPLSPSGILNNWSYSFSWTGVSDATWYLLEVQTSTGVQVFRKWYTSAQTNCAGGTACSVTPTNISLPNGDYKWRVLDYGAYGYGINSAFKNFTLNGIACYTLTTYINPGGGNVTVPAQTCPGGYTAGSVIQLTAAPNAGFIFSNWSGDASGSTNPVSVTMNANKSVTANFKATPVLVAPNGALVSWNNTFSWSGLPNATWYLLEVYTADGSVQVFRKWYTSSQTNCSSGTSCFVSPPETAGLANGNYKWRILDYGAYGYGTWTEFMFFTLNQ